MVDLETTEQLVVIADVVVDARSEQPFLVMVHAGCRGNWRKALSAAPKAISPTPLRLRHRHRGTTDRLRRSVMRRALIETKNPADNKRSAG